MTTVLSTEGMRLDQREAFWQHAMSHTFAPVAICPAAPRELAGQIDVSRFGRLMIAGVKSTAQDINRTPNLIGETDNAYFQVALMAAGVGRVSQDERQAELRQGDCCVCETTRPFRWLFESRWEAWIFCLPADSVRLTESERRLISATRIDGRNGITGVVSRFLLDIARHSESLPAEQSERVLAHAGDLVITLLSQQLNPTDSVRGAAQRSLVLKTKGYIDQHLGDPGLGPSQIAAAANISTRYLHKLFEAEHHTVSLYIKELRLQRARQHLLDPRMAGRAVSAIAHECGFGDLSGFNRAFKAAYGVSPMELRNAHAVMGRGWQQHGGKEGALLP